MVGASRGFLPNGKLDTSFGANGQLKPADGIGAFAVQSNGDIVVACESGQNVVLSRYLPDGGGLDTSFGNAGQVTAKLPTAILAMTIEPNGQIVVATDTAGSPASPASPDDTVARFNSDGSVDTSFGTNGVATVTLAAAPGGAVAGAWLFTQSDGKLLLVQNNGAMGNGADLDVARLTASGQLDSSYGNNGQVTVAYQNGIGELAAGLAPADKLVLAAPEAGTSGGLLLSEYNANGALDGSFGTSGQTTINDANFESLGNPTILFQSNGQFIIPGAEDVGSPPTSSLAALRRFNADGSVDTTFGTNGLVTTSFVSGNYENYSYAAQQSDGKIVAAGFSAPSGGGAGESIMARYLITAPTPPVNPAPPGVGFLAGVPGDGTPQTFVHNLYRELLGREPDAGGLAGWVSFLDAHNAAAGRLDVIQGFLNSPEYKDHYVTTLYETILGRAPDAGGLQFWTQKMGDPGTPGQNTGSADERFILAAFLGSDEFYADAGGKPQGWLNALYEDVLGRATDPTSTAFWTSVLSGTGDRDGIARAVLASPEAAHEILNSFYPAPGGAASTPLAAAGTKAGARGDDLSLLTGGGWENLYLQGPYGSAPEGNDQFSAALAGGGNWDDIQSRILATDQFFTGSNPSSPQPSGSPPSSSSGVPPVVPPVVIYRGG